MRYVLKRISLLAAALLIAAVPVLADEGSMDRSFDQGMQSEKNECLLVATNCGNSVDSFQQRIDRIRGEIARGSDVYTQDELSRLNRELNEYIKAMNEQQLGS